MYISGISFNLGELKSVDNLIDAGSLDDEITRLKEKDILTYSEIENCPYEIIFDCVKTTLEDTNNNADDIDAILFVTESFEALQERCFSSEQCDFLGARNALFERLIDHGFIKAPIFCTTFGGSSNFLQGMCIAQSFLNSGAYSNVLVICIDLHTNRTSRFIDDAIAVAGDSVAVCLLSKKKLSGGFKIQHVNINAFQQSQKSLSIKEKMFNIYKATRESAANCFQKTELEPDKFNWLLLGNYNLLTSQIFSKLIGISLNKTWQHNVSRTGHLPSCDPLVNLGSLLKSQPEQESKILQFINGPISCGAIVLSVV